MAVVRLRDENKMRSKQGCLGDRRLSVARTGLWRHVRAYWRHFRAMKFGVGATHIFCLSVWFEKIGYSGALSLSLSATRD